MTDKLVENDQLVGHLQEALRDGQSGLRYVPKLLKRVLEEEAWRKRYHWASKTGVGFNSFAEFVTAPLTEGLGVDIDFVRRMVADDKAARDLLTQAVQGHQGERTDLVNNMNEVRPQGTSAEAALRRLRKDRPDLHAKVLKDELSPHAAMVEAGFRPRTQTVRVDDPEAVARTLTRHMRPEARARLKELL